ncbi:MAG: DUF4292 domain-containing protein [Chitinophagaceae bacterium]
MKKILLLVIIGVFIFSSCRSVKKTQTAVVTRDTTVTEIKPPDNVVLEDTAALIRSSYDLLQSNRIKISTFSAKVDVKYKDPEGKKYDVNANIRMYYDSVIWVSVTGLLGLEGVRAYITHDSVKVIDKQNKTYTSKSVAYLQQLTELPLDLVSLQDLLLGNPLFFNSNISSFSRSSGTISLLSVGEFFKNLLTINEENKLMISSKLDDIVDSGERTSLLTYNNYENKKGFSFSINRIINVEGKKKIDIELDFRQYNFNETLSFPFNVPKNYKRNLMNKIKFAGMRCKQIILLCIFKPISI